MSEHKAFMLYHDLCKIFDDMPDDEAGKLIKEIVKTARDISDGNPKKPTGLSGLLKAVFNPFEAHLIRDSEKWNRRRERNISNGKLGGRPSSKPKLTQTNPKKGVKVKVKVKDNVNIDSKESINPLTPLPENWDLFLKFRKEIRKPVTESQKPALLKKAYRLASESRCMPDEILQQSIENGWQGIFALRKESENDKRSTTRKYSSGDAISEIFAELREGR